MKLKKWNPGTLQETSGSFWLACTLHAGVELDLFSLIGNGGMTCEQVAEKLGTDQRATTVLLNALVAMSLLVKREEIFSNTQEAIAFLTKDSPQYIGYIIRHHHYLVESWSKLDQAVREGRPMRQRAGSIDNAQNEAFLMGMFNNAMAIAPRVASELDLSGRKRLLDFGGGPGSFAIHFCKHYPDLTAMVCDLASTRPFAEKTIARFGLTDRIEFVAFDYLSQDVPGTYDVVWLSHILHAEGPDICRKILAKAVKALEPEGLIAIHDFIMEDTLDSPVFPALFSLNMLLGTDQGRSYSEKQITAMMVENGIREIRRLPFRGPTESSILVGKTPKN